MSNQIVGSTFGYSPAGTKHVGGTFTIIDSVTENSTTYYVALFDNGATVRLKAGRNTFTINDKIFSTYIEGK